MKKDNTQIIEEILTSDRVAEILDVSKRVIEDKLRSKEMKGYKKFNKWYVLKSELIEFLRSELSQ